MSAMTLGHAAFAAGEIASTRSLMVPSLVDPNMSSPAAMAPCGGFLPAIAEDAAGLPQIQGVGGSAVSIVNAGSASPFSAHSENSQAPSEPKEQKVSRLLTETAAHLDSALDAEGLDKNSLMGKELMHSYVEPPRHPYDTRYDYKQTWTVWTKDKGYRIQIEKGLEYGKDEGWMPFRNHSVIPVPLQSQSLNTASDILAKAAEVDVRSEQERQQRIQESTAHEEKQKQALAAAHLNSVMRSLGLSPADFTTREQTVLLSQASQEPFADRLDYHETWRVSDGNHVFEIEIVRGKYHDKDNGWIPFETQSHKRIK